MDMKTAIAIAAAALAMAGCATTGTKAPVAADSPVETTGTRIPGGTSGQLVQVITQDELGQTGGVDLSSRVRSLIPSSW